MKEKINLAIADDHTLVRDGLKRVLNDDSGINVLYDVSNGKELIKKLEVQEPDIILMDIEMPLLSGREALIIIRERFPKVKVIILSSHFQENIVIDFFKLEANAFLPKNCKTDKLMETIRKVHKDGIYYDTEVSKIIAGELAGSGKKTGQKEQVVFTDIERSIIKLICQDKLNKEIADILNIKLRSVEYHRLNIMKNINAKNVSELIAYAVQNKLVNVF